MRPGIAFKPSLLLVLALALALFSGALSANIALTTCANLNTASTTYDLQNTIQPVTGEANSSCFNITAANVVLDGHNFAIFGNSNANSIGVNVSAFSATLRNLNISAFQTGIQYNSSTANNSLVNNVTINVTRNSGTGIAFINGNFTTINATSINSTGSAAPGINSSGAYNITVANSTIVTSGTNSIAINLVSNSNNWTIFNNTLNVTGSASVINLTSTTNFETVSFNTINLSNNGATGIKNAGANSTFANNTINCTAGGVFSETGQNNTFANNTINSTCNTGIFEQGRFNLISFNLFNTTNTNAISINSGSNNTVINNTMYERVGNGFAVLTLTNGAQNNTIANNTINSTSTTVYAIESSSVATRFNSILSNTLIATSYGVYLHPGSNTTVSNNTIITSGNAAYGIYLSTGAQNNTIANNTINTSGTTSNGIYSDTAGDNLNQLLSNTINTTNTGHGIELKPGSNTTIANNTIFISNQNAFGIYLTATSQNNTLANNTINTSGGQGVYIDGTGTNRFNQVLSNTINDTFTNYGIYLFQTGNNTIANNTVYTTGSGASGIVIQSNSPSTTSANNNIIANNTINTSGSAAHAIVLQGALLTQVLNNVVNTTNTGRGIYLTGSGGNNTVANNTVYTSTAAAHGISLDASQNDTIANNTINTSGSSANGLYLSTSIVNFTTVTGNVVNVTGASADAINITASNNNTFTNNTLSSSSAITLDIDATARNNTFYYNNFTKGSKFIRSKEPGAVTTQFNTTVNGVAQGNYYSDISILNIFDSDNDTYGDTGTAYPYNSTNTANISGNITDYGPKFARLFLSIVSDLNFTNATAGHWFYANATAFDPNGGTDVTWVRANATSGSCVQFSNSTSGVNFSVVFNCSGTALTTASVYIAFNSSGGKSINTSNLANAFPNQAPAIASNLAFTNASIGHWFYANATANDSDGAADITWVRINTTVGSCVQFSNATSGVNFSVVYNCSSSSNATTSVYIAFNDSTGASVNTTNKANAFPNQAPAIASNLAFTNASSGHWFYANATANDSDGGSDISWVNISSSAGSCVQFSNSTSGVNFSVVYNCSATSPAIASVNITFNDTSGASANTSTLNNTYPDLPPTLTGLAVHGAFTNLTATCSGTFSDPDGDSENTSADFFTWLRNGTVVSGENQSTLNLTFYALAVGENLSCNQTATPSTWGQYTANATSANATVAQATALLVAYFAPDSSYLAKTDTTNITASINASTTMSSISLRITYPGGSSTTPANISFVNDTLDNIYNRTWNLAANETGNYTLVVTALDSNGQSVNKTIYLYASAANITLNLSGNGTTTFYLYDAQSGRGVANSSNLTGTQVPPGNYTVFVTTSLVNITFTQFNVTSVNGTFLNFSTTSAAGVVKPADRRNIILFNISALGNYSSVSLLVDYSSYVGSLASESSVEMDVCHVDAPCNWSIVNGTNVSSWALINTTLDTSIHRINGTFTSIGSLYGLFEPGFTTPTTTTTTTTTFVTVSSGGGSTTVNVPFEVDKNITIEVPKEVRVPGQAPPVRLLSGLGDVLMAANSTHDSLLTLTNAYGQDLGLVSLTVQTDPGIGATLTPSSVRLGKGQSATAILHLVSGANTGNYSVQLKASASSPGVEDTLTLTAHVVSNLDVRQDVRQKIDFANALIQSNPDCLDLSSSLTISALYLDSGQTAEANATADRVISGCTALLSLQGRPAAPGGPAPGVDAPTLIMLVVAISGLLSALLLGGFMLTRHKRK